MPDTPQPAPLKDSELPGPRFIGPPEYGIIETGRPDPEALFWDWMTPRDPTEYGTRPPSDNLLRILRSLPIGQRDPEVIRSIGNEIYEDFPDGINTLVATSASALLVWARAWGILGNPAGQNLQVHGRLFNLSASHAVFGPEISLRTKQRLPIQDAMDIVRSIPHTGPSTIDDGLWHPPEMSIRYEEAGGKSTFIHFAIRPDVDRKDSFVEGLNIFGRLLETAHLFTIEITRREEASKKA